MNKINTRIQVIILLQELTSISKNVGFIDITYIYIVFTLWQKEKKQVTIHIILEKGKQNPITKMWSSS